MNIITNESSQLISIALIRPIGGTLVGVFKNKTTNDIVKITIEDVEEHTTFAKVTIDASVLYGGEWSYRFFYNDEDGYEVLVSQNIAYVNQVARYEVATAERTYSTQESVRGVCPPCPPCPNAYYINVQTDFTMASVAGSCDKAQEDALLFIGCQPREGYRFVRWDDDDSESTFNPRYVIVRGDKTYTAICEPVPPTPTTTTHTISVTADEHSTAIGGGTYEENTTASIGIVASKGYRFVSWNDGNVENPRQVVVDADKNYTAVVEQIPTYNVTASLIPSSSLVSVVGTGTFYEGATTTIGCNIRKDGSGVLPYYSSTILYRNGERVGAIPLPYTIENIDADYSVEIPIKITGMKQVHIKLADESGTDIGEIESPNGMYYANYYWDGDDTNWARGVLNAAKEGYKFLRWSDGNTDNPRTVDERMLSNYQTTFTAIMERVQEGGNKRVNIENNDAINIVCPQREGTIGSVLPWRVRKTKPFVVVDFDTSANQQYNGGGVNDTAIWSIANYQDGNPWQGLIMLSDDDDRNIIKYNVREYPGADFGNNFTPSVSNTTFQSIVGQEGTSYYNVAYLEFNNMWGVIDYNEITNKFFEPIIDGGQRSGQGVNYTWVANAQAYNSGFGTNWNCINFANYSNGQFMTQKYGDCYIKRQGDELIVEYRNGDNDIAQWHIGITSDYVYVVFSNWVSQLNNVWFNDGTGHFKYVDTNMAVVECKDEYGNDFYPWDRIELTCQLTSTPTDGMVIRMDVVPNTPKRLDVEVAYSEKVIFYENFQNVCQPYSNNSDDFIVGDKYISETTGVNFYEFVGDRLPMVASNATQLSKYEVKSVMPDIVMLQDNFLNGARLNDWSWLFDKLTNIQTIENNVLNSTDVRTFEPTAGQWSQLTTIGSSFLGYSMVERVDFTNLTNLTTLRSQLCYGCGNLTYANISKFKDLTEYDNSAWFAQCPNLRDIVFDGSVGQYQTILDSLVWFGNKSNCTLHVDSAYLQDYIDMYGGEWMNIVAIE